MDREIQGNPASQSMHLRYLGFCGVDDSVEQELLELISQRYPRIEWGVLFRPDLEGTPRYASTAWVESLSRWCQLSEGRMHLAAHLCGSRCQDVLEGDVAFLGQLCAWGFGRVQINATKANSVHWVTERLQEYVQNMLAAFRSNPKLEFIIQCNDETQPIWTALQSATKSASDASNMSFLLDASCGLGKEISTFLPPFDGIPTGYAGGIGPSTIATTLDGVSSVAGGKEVWIDMESSLRTRVMSGERGADGSPLPLDGQAADMFDVAKAFQCIRICTEKGISLTAPEGEQQWVKRPRL